MAERRQEIESNVLVNNNPLVKIGGVPILEQNFTWAKTAGVTPFTTSVIIPVSLDNDMRSNVNPVDISVVFRGGVGKQNFDRPNSFVIKKCFLHEPKVISEFDVKWEISDCRYTLRGQKCFFNYNETRIKNDLALVNPQQIKANIVTDPSALRVPFDAFARGRYVKPSIKQDNTPFTISEIIKIEFAKKGFNVRFPSNLSSFDYTIDNIRAEGEDFYTVMTSLLAKARMSVFVDLDGDLELYSIDFFDQVSAQSLIDLGNKQKSLPGQFYFEEKKKTRPSKVIVRFEKMVETMISFADINPDLRADGSQVAADRREEPAEVKVNNATNQQQAQQLTTIPCINVVQANFVPANFLGRYNVGEYIEVGEYLKMLGFTKDFLRTGFFGDLFSKELTFRLIGDNLEQISLARAIAGNIKSSFRQLFMIDPYYIDRIKKWEAKKVAVIDQFSGYRAPSPLFQDFFSIPRVRDIQGARGQLPTSTKFTYSVFIDQFDPQRTKGNPGTISIVNPDLGIFQVQYPPVSDSVVLEVGPSALEEDIEVNPSTGRFHLIDDANLSQEHIMETLVSVVWNYDDKDSFDSTNINNPTGKYHDVEFDFSQGGGNFGPSEGPPVTIMCTKEYARYNRNLQIVNNTIVDALAEAEAGKLMNKFRDRFGGVLSLPDWIDFPVIGNIASIIYVLSPAEGAYTTINAAVPPFDPTVEQSVPDNVRQYLYRQLNPKTGP